MIHRPAFCLVVGAALLSACGGDAPPEETEAEAERNAKGEVIGGTISDAMIPLDQLRSQSPPMPEATTRSSNDTATTDEETPVEPDAGAEPTAPDSSPAPVDPEPAED